MAGSSEPLERCEQLIRLIAHDLRNPLTAVKLNGQLIEQAAARDGQEKQRRWASAIVDSARRMDEMLQSLVEAECVRSGKIALPRESVALNQLLPDLLIEQGAVIDAPRIRLRLPAEPAVVVGDRSRLGQALAFLLRLAAQEVDAAAEILVEVEARAGDIRCVIRASRSPRATPWAMAELPAAPAGQAIPLHVARTVIACHRGSLRICDPDGSTLEYEVVLPREGSSAGRT
jgi:signal transduction histidine kinase